MLMVTLKRAAFGFLLGNFIGYIIAFLTSGNVIPVSPLLTDRVGGLAPALLIQILASGAYGSICFGGISFYEIERWPLALSSSVHCVVIIICYIPLALALDWVETLYDILIMASLQLVVYFIIWLIICAVYKAQVKELNEIQKKFNNRKEQLK